MAAAETDYFTKVGSPGTATTLSAPGHTIAGTSITVISTTNWPTTTGAIFAMDTFTLVNGVEVRDVGSYTEWEGIVASSTSITNMVLRYGTDQNYAAGTTTRVYIPVSSSRENRLVDGMLVEHDQDGTHSNITATSITATTGTFTNFTINGTSGADGWSPLGQSLTSITALGNRSYTAVVSGVDTTGVTCVGQRLKLPRTVTAPTGSITLNGTSQYLSKATPTGISFTGDHSYQVKIKPTAYQNGFLCSRVTGGNTGFALLFNSSGQIQVQYGNGASLTQIMTYQSVPLNKWTNISVAVSVAAKTAVILLDGVSVPTYLVAGTATTVVQPAAATTLSIGADNAGANFFAGKIAQAGLFTTAVASATLRGYEGQTLSGSESNLISAYKLDQASGLTDLNANANNLTAQGSPSYSTTDTPFTNPVTGTSVTAGTTNYGIIMAQTFSTNTTYTIQIPEGETLPTTGGIGTVSYSTQKTPYGFPGQRGKWELEYLIHVNTSIGTTANSYNNLPSAGLYTPQGAWDIRVQGNLYCYNSTATGISGLSVLMGTASAAAGQVSKKLTTSIYVKPNTGQEYFAQIRLEDYIENTTGRQLYMNAFIDAGVTLTGLQWHIGAPSITGAGLHISLVNSHL